MMERNGSLTSSFQCLNLCINGCIPKVLLALVCHHVGNIIMGGKYEFERSLVVVDHYFIHIYVWLAKELHHPASPILACAHHS